MVKYFCERAPERVNSGGKWLAAVTSATRIRFALGRTIYIVWVSGKEVKTPFLLPKKNIFVRQEYKTIRLYKRQIVFYRVRRWWNVCSNFAQSQHLTQVGYSLSLRPVCTGIILSFLVRLCSIYTLTMFQRFRHSQLSGFLSVSVVNRLSSKNNPSPSRSMILADQSSCVYGGFLKVLNKYNCNNIHINQLL